MATWIVLAVMVAVVLWVSGIGEWLCWNASYLLGRQASERRAIWRLELKLGLLKTLARAIARLERRGGPGSPERHTRG